MKPWLAILALVAVVILSGAVSARAAAPKTQPQGSQDPFFTQLNKPGPVVSPLPERKETDPDIVLRYDGALNDDLKDVCDSMYLAMLQGTEYLTYDPALDTSGMTDNGANMSSGDTLVLGTSYLTRPIWSDMANKNKPLDWRRFSKDDHEKFLDMIDQGEEYGFSYEAYRSYSNLWGRIVLTEKEPIYKLVPKSRMSKMKLPVLYMTPGSSLAKAVNDLHAQDIVLRGARGFPIVREPGKIRIFAINADRDDVDYADQKFSTEQICTVRSFSTLARYKKTDDGDVLPQPPAPPPPPDAAVDPCLGKTGGDYSACVAAQKLLRLKKLKDQQDSQFESAASGAEPAPKK